MAQSGGPLAEARSDFDFLDLNITAKPHVLAIRHSATGRGLAMSMSDHKIRVYGRPHGTRDEWSLVDQWRGHDAEILDIKWICCRQGEFLASTGYDNQFKMWVATPSHNKGRRYRRIFSQSPSNRVPYPTFDYFSIEEDVYLVLISNTGLCTVLEPADSERLQLWKEVDAFSPFGQVQKSVGPAFGLSCHAPRSSMSEDYVRKQGEYSVTIAVSYQNIVKIFHSIKSGEDNHAFQEVHELRLNKSFVTDVLWAPPGLHLDPLLSVLLQTGKVRLFTVSTKSNTMNVNKNRPDAKKRSSERDSFSRQVPATSGIGAGLAGLHGGASIAFQNDPGIDCEAQMVAKLKLENRVPVIQTLWDLKAEIFVTVGMDRSAHFWRRDLEGEWFDYAELSQEAVDMDTIEAQEQRGEVQRTRLG